MMRPALAHALLVAAAEELRRLRVVRGAHLRTRRRRRMLVALAMGASLGIDAPVMAADPSFFSVGTEYGSPVDFGDLDGDGDLDMVTTENSNPVFVENTGSALTPAFAAPNASFGMLGLDVDAPKFADIDGDGDLDLLGRDGGMVTFSENTGTAAVPAFAPEVLKPFGLTGPIHGPPTFADLDADGDLDVLVGVGAGALQYAENTGSTTAPGFAPLSAGAFGLTAVGSFPHPEFVDIDGDGDLDLFVGTRQESLAFFENVGTSASPQFGPPTFRPFGIARTYGASRLAFADIDGDGDFDAVLSDDYDYVPLLVNRGTANVPAFDSPTPAGDAFGFPDVVYGSVPTFGDLDGDGDLDALLGQYDGYTVQIHNGGSASNPRFGAGNPFGIGSEGEEYPATVTAVDIDHDGDLDLFVGGSGDGWARFWENTGSPNAPAFAPAQETAFGLDEAGDQYVATAFGDIDGDGDLDALIGHGSSYLLFAANTGSATTPAFDSFSINPFGLQVTGQAGFRTKALPRFADIDGDGDLDVFLGQRRLWWLENTGTPSSPAFAPGVENPFGLVSQWRVAPDFADLDGDGDLDALVGSEYGEVLFAENTGGPTAPAFAPAQSQAFGLRDQYDYSAVALGDIDGDGDFDAFVATKYGITTFVENTGSATQPAFWAGAHDLLLVPRLPVGYTAPALADIDGDGDLDVFVGDRSGDTNFFENTGTPSVPRLGPASLNPFGIASVSDNAHLAFVDIDGDLDLDLFIGESGGDTIFAENVGTTSAPAFGSPQVNAFGIPNLGYSDVAPHFADLDGDGDFDAFVGEHLGRVYWLENTGSSAVPAFAAPATNPFGIADFGKFSTPFFVDIDGDGDLDYFTGEYDGKTIFSRNGLPGPTPVPSPTPTPGDVPVLPFMEYKVKEADRTGTNGILSSSCRVTLDDPLFGFGGLQSAENYRVSLVRSLGLPADRENAGTTDVNGTHLLGLLIRGTAKGALPPNGGSFTPTRKHGKRTGVLVRILDDALHDGAGDHTIRVDTKKETRLLVPTGQSTLGPPGAPNDDANHFKCYKVKASIEGGVTGSLQDAKGKEQKNLQVVVTDQFADGQGHPMYADGRRFDLRKVTELCNPVAISNVNTAEQDASGATRSSTCTIEPAAARAPATSLLCWGVRLARLELEQPWTLTTPPVSIQPRQEKHRKRTEANGDAVHLTHGFEAPDLVNTSKERQLCLPVVVIDPGTVKP